MRTSPTCGAGRDARLAAPQRLVREGIAFNPAKAQERLRVFPITGAAAMRHKEEILFATWSALGLLDPNGSGRISRIAARDFIASWRGIDLGSARRILRDGERSGYWCAARDGNYLHLAGIARLMLRHDVEHERTPRLIPISSMRSLAQIRAALYAAVHELPGHAQRFHNAPLSRATKETLTGASRTAQKRYDRLATDLVQVCVAEVDTTEDLRLVGNGFFIGHGGRQFRRLPDYRVPHDQWLASKTAARHATAKARRLREAQERGAAVQPPVFRFRGLGTSSPPLSPHTRTFFTGKDEQAALEHAPTPVDRRGPIVLAWGRAGEMKFRIIERRTRR